MKIITSAEVIKVSQKDLQVKYFKSSKTHVTKSDFILFATDPLTAARKLGDENLIQKISKKQFGGSSGNLSWRSRSPFNG